jgi:glycosyltransferase involved in cell wall biosynthesis
MRGADTPEPSRKIRVVWYCDAHEVGGAEILLSRMLPLLSSRFEVTLVGTDRYVLNRIRRGRPDTNALLLPDILTKWRLRAIGAHVSAIRRLRPHVLHISLNRPWGSQWAVLGGLVLPGIRVVAVEASPRSSPALRHRLYKRITSPFLDAHVTMSETMAVIVAELSGVPRSRVRTIWIGVPDEPVVELQRPATGPVVGCFARLDASKGIDLLLRAMPDLPDVTAVIVGSGKEHARLVALADSLNVSDRVVFAGWSDSHRNYLTIFDLYVQPSRFEGLPISIIEAMLAELPVVATDVGGVRDGVIHGQTGVLVPPEDPAALARAIRQVLADPGAMHLMGRTGREVAVKRFGMERMVAEYEALYAELADGERSEAQTASLGPTLRPRRSAPS